MNRPNLFAFRTCLQLTVAIFVGVACASAQDRSPETSVNVFPLHDEIGSADYPFSRAIAEGRELFEARFTREDGAGRPMATGDSKPTARHVAGPYLQRISGPDANSCAGCHNQPRTGGSGDFATNVFVGAHFSDPVADQIASRVTNERNTTDLFGTGAIEIAATEMTADLHRLRDSALEESKRTGQPITTALQTKGISFGHIVAHPSGYVDMSGVDGVDYALIVRPFGAKGITASLREFTIAALNQHHGIQAIERFGWERTGVRDFDGDDVEVEFTAGQVSALVLFQAALPVPNKNRRLDATGLALFRSAQCDSCHVPRIDLNTNIFTEPNFYNRPGTLRRASHNVRMPLEIQNDGSGSFIEPFSDLKRHVMCDDEIKFLCNEERRQDNVHQWQFMTSRLWNLANTAPYCHRGDCPTVNDAILVHGGDARKARESYLAMNETERRKLILFLKELGSDLTE